MSLYRKFTPELITELKKNEIFVFGSNLNGNHTTEAYKFGAVKGIFEGLQGQSYAIATLDHDMKKLSVLQISKRITELYDFANANTHLNFYVTKLGCDDCNFEIKEIANIFKSFDFTPFNIILPVEFSKIKGVKGFGERMICSPGNNPFKYFENEDFECEKAIICHEGFHFCENPLDTLHYYSNKNNNEFAEVIGEGQISTDLYTSKIAVTKLKVENKIDFDKLFELGIEFVFDKLQKFLFKKRDNILNNKIKLNASYGRNLNKLSGRDSDTLVGLDFNTLAAHDKNTLIGRDVNSLSGNNCNILTGNNHNALSGQNSNLLIVHNWNTLAGMDSNTLASKSNNSLSGQSYNVLIGSECNSFAGYDSNTIIGENHNVLVGNNSNVLSVQNSNIIACNCNNIINMIGSNNVAIGANNTKMKGLKNNVMCFVEINKSSVPITKTIVIDGRIYKENTYYHLHNGEIKEC